MAKFHLAIVFLALCLAPTFVMAASQRGVPRDYPTSDDTFEFLDPEAEDVKAESEKSVKQEAAAAVRSRLRGAPVDASSSADDIVFLDEDAAEVGSGSEGVPRDYPTSDDTIEFLDPLAPGVNVESQGTEQQEDATAVRSALREAPVDASSSADDIVFLDEHTAELPSGSMKETAEQELVMLGMGAEKEAEPTLSPQEAENKAVDDWIEANKIDFVLEALKAGVLW